MGREQREQIVMAHIEAENRGDVAATVATFATPRYEVVPTGEVHDGVDAVTRFLAETTYVFPDMKIALDALHHADDAVIVEVTFAGTQRRSWRGLPATRRRVTYRMCNAFLFDRDRLRCERLYFDMLTAMRGLGIARDPTTAAGRISVAVNHPLTLLGAALGSLRR